MPTKVTFSMPQEAARKLREKYEKDPEAFKAFAKQNGFDCIALGFPKYKVVKVEVGFSESPRVQGHKAPWFSNMADANTFFAEENRHAEWERQTGRLLGYYKTDFTLTFEDGTKYEGRYDIGSDDADLTTHVRRFAECYSGRIKPAHLTDRQWEQFNNSFVSEKSREYFGNLLDSYDIES